MWTIFFLLLANVIYIHMCLSSHSSCAIFFFEFSPSPSPSPSLRSQNHALGHQALVAAVATVLVVVVLCRS